MSDDETYWVWMIGPRPTEAEWRAFWEPRRSEPGTPIYQRIFPNGAIYDASGWPEDWKADDGSKPFWADTPLPDV